MEAYLDQQGRGKFAAAAGGGGGVGGELLMVEESMNSGLTSASAPATAPTKRKRGLPGTPDPDAEVIALSPRTLMATNRFVCEVCNKGFQRDQNLQLHRRGHNLPWKLKQRPSKDGAVRKVYICPESTCVHHAPSHALGDLTGIKKHYFRKHGEKRWKCDKCSKKYAVHSDWKAHVKVCSTREYRCDCGTVFSRRDSFITHRAFCDALTEETAKAVPAVSLVVTLGAGIQSTDEQLQDLALEEEPQHQQVQSRSLVKPEQHPWAQYNAEMLLLADPFAAPAASSTSLAPLWATALLLKAAQMGATTSQSCGQMATHDNADGVLHPGVSYAMSSATTTIDGIGSEGLTRDFLGLRALSQGEMISLACINPSQNAYHYTMQQQQLRGKQPWNE